VHETGRREIPGTDVGEAEGEAFWREFVCSLVARGLSGVLLCVSDAHVGFLDKQDPVSHTLGCSQRTRSC
jgi:transposase-like protein